MDGKPLFDNPEMIQRLDEVERTYAPQQLPADDPEQARVRADDLDQSNPIIALDAPAAAPVANLGSSPSGLAAPPNIGHADHGGAPGDPGTQARNPWDPDREMDPDAERQDDR
jgi:hypothetical protein